MWSQRSFRTLLGRFTVICLDEPAPDEENISDSDIPALRLRTDVNALVFSALVQFFEADGVVVVRVVLDSLLVGVSAVVEEHASTGDAVFGPVVDGAFVVGFWADNVFTVGVVVEGASWDMGKLQFVSELNGALRSRDFPRVGIWGFVSLSFWNGLEVVTNPSHCVPLCVFNV